METCGVIDRSHHHGTLPVSVSRPDDYLNHCCVLVSFLSCEARISMSMWSRLSVAPMHE